MRTKSATFDSQKRTRRVRAHNCRCPSSITWPTQVAVGHRTQTSARRQGDRCLTINTWQNNVRSSSARWFLLCTSGCWAGRSFENNWNERKTKQTWRELVIVLLNWQKKTQQKCAALRALTPFSFSLFTGIGMTVSCGRRTTQRVRGWKWESEDRWMKCREFSEREENARHTLMSQTGRDFSAAGSCITEKNRHNS